MFKNRIIRSMIEFQKKYFPNDVNKKCPCCGREIETNKVNIGWVRDEHLDATTRE